MKNPNNLRKLEEINLREAWDDEARDFTPWLAQEANIGLLGNAIGIDLEVEAREKNIGQFFKTDIICKEVINGIFV